MTPHELIEKTYAEVLPGRFASEAATVMLLAIGQQESRFAHRQQIGGPARGFWQFEERGGVRGVLYHQATARHARAVCALRDVMPYAPSVYGALHTDDLLACAFARLLLFTDPYPLPQPGMIITAWDYYLRNWRPGKPHRSTWDTLYTSALLRPEESRDV
jgi:hypothetical protein